SPSWASPTIRTATELDQALAADALNSDEKEELRRLRRENREQQQTIEILKKAAAFFAKESTK
ncbi:hypothetical protein ACFP2V_27100, partial [Streptomyces incanus]